MNPRIVDVLIGFIVGVTSSLVAGLLLIYLNSNHLVTRAIARIVHRRGLERLRGLQGKTAPESDDPLAVIRADWVCALYDLGSTDPETIRKTLQALFHMSDLLSSNEKDIAHEALRLAFAVNPFRQIDRQYTDTIHRLDS